MSNVSSKNYYNKISKNYDELYHKEQIQKIEKIKKFLDEINQKNNLKILDLGCGDGILNRFLTNENNEVFSFDISNKMLEKNSNKNENKFLCDFEKEKLNLKDKSIDFIFSFSVFQDLNIFENIFLEILRVIKKNCVLIISFVKFIDEDKKQKISKFFEENFEIENIIESKVDLIYILKNKN